MGKSYEAYADLHDAIWVVLDADADITELLGHGTKYRWQGGLLQQLTIDPMVCPFLSVSPSGEMQFPSDHRAGAPSYAAKVELGTLGRDSRKGLRLLLAVLRALRDGAATRYGTSQPITHAVFGSVSIGPYPAEKSPEGLWVATFTVNILYRSGTVL